MGGWGLAPLSGDDFTIMDYLKRHEYNAVFDINNGEQIGFTPTNIRDTIQETIDDIIDNEIRDNEEEINEEVVEEEINEEVVEGEINEEVFEEEINEDVFEEEIYHEEHYKREIPITTWGPDSYFIDFLDRHYAALIIQERWREYSLYL